MSNGRIVTWYPPVEVNVAMLESQSATGSGPWIEVPAGLTVWSFAVSSDTTLEEGASDATVDIMVLNDETKPASSTDGPIAATLTVSTPSAGITQSAYRWCKAVKTAGTTPAGVTVFGRFTPASSP